MKMADYVIVGAGIAGIATAEVLSRIGAEHQDRSVSRLQNRVAV